MYSAIHAQKLLTEMKWFRTPPQSEMFPAAVEGGVPCSYADMPIDERTKLLKERLKKYCQKARGGPDIRTPLRSLGRPFSLTASINALDRTVCPGCEQRTGPIQSCLLMAPAARHA